MVMDPWLFRPPVLVGERVVWLGSGSGLPQGGVVRWIGKLPEMGPDWTVGLQLDNPLPYGGIDGTWGNRHLFTCEPKHGLIVPITKTVREADLLSWPFNSHGLKIYSLLSKTRNMKNPQSLYHPGSEEEKSLADYKLFL
ncbi:Protein of unknown function, partial [Gryllus bimaculatus]